MPSFIEVHTAKRWYYDFLEFYSRFKEDSNLTSRENLELYEKKLIKTTKRFRKGGHVIFIDDIDSRIEETAGKYHNEIAPTKEDTLLCDREGEVKCANKIIEILNDGRAYVGGVYEDACVLFYTGYLATHGIGVNVIESCTDAIFRKDGCEMLSCLVFSTNDNVHVTPYSRDRQKIIGKSLELRSKLKNWKNLTEIEKTQLIETASKFKTRSNYIFKPFAYYTNSDRGESLAFGDEKSVITLAGERGISAFEARELLKKLYRDFERQKDI